MALTTKQLREKLSEFGIPAENIDAAVSWIMDGHITSLEALREARDSYKADAEKLVEVQKELDEIKAKGDGDWQQKWEQEHSDFESFKVAVEAEKERAKKTELYRALLKDCNVYERQIASILKVSADKIDGLTVKDGKLDDVDGLMEEIRRDWSGFIMKDGKEGAKVDTPPSNGGGGKPEESRAAKIAAEYHKNLYGEMKGD